MNILVIFTGGTIGSTVQNGWIDTSSETKYTLINKYREISGDKETLFSFSSPYTILSENLSHKELNLLFNTAEENLNKNYDGIIITHGTDTLQYTSSALEFMFSDSNIPIMVVSANFPLEDKRSNGVENFGAAVAFIKSRIASGVFVSYKNAGSTSADIHIPTRISSHPEASDDIICINKEPFAFVKNGNVYKNDNCILKTPFTAQKTELCEQPDILMISSYPNDTFNYPLTNYKAVILCPYHSGTLNTESPYLKSFCKKASELNIPIFLTNVYADTAYKSTQLFASHNIVVLPFCTKTSVYMKCWIGISLKKDLLNFVKSPLAFEFIN